MAYNIKEDVKAGDPDHPKHHEDLAVAVNDLDVRAAAAQSSADTADGKAEAAETSAQNAASDAANALSAATAASEAVTTLEAEVVKTDDVRLSNPREPHPDYVASDEFPGWIRGIYRNPGDTLPEGLQPDTLVIERP